MGPVGSSKSSACSVEIFNRACLQKHFNGVRKTRWAVLRNTYPELKSTTIKTWQQWFPYQIAPMKWDSPISSHISLPLPDKTTVEAEILFIPLDRPEDVDKLRSLELTGAWMNEASEMAKPVLDMLTQRVGRYPPVKEGGPSWYGVFMDTNPPDDDHWYYRLSEREKPEGWEFFKQPGGLLEKQGIFEDNPLAENVPNLPGGYRYYHQQIPGKAKEWIKVFLLGQYGTVGSGKPVYPEYNDDIHCKEIEADPGLPLILGFDYGLTPACAICQLSPHGSLYIIDELFATDMGIEQFARDIVKPHLANNYSTFSFHGAGDPAGVARRDTDERTCFMLLAEQGIPCVPASSNAVIARREAVARYLTKLVDGHGGLLIHPRCDMIRRGFNGRYHYKRVQVSGERFKDVPEKNEYSHIHDALQYACLYSQNMSNSKEWAQPVKYPELGLV